MHEFANNNRFFLFFLGIMNKLGYIALIGEQLL
jgi:hypothetical protein